MKQRFIVWLYRKIQIKEDGITKRKKDLVSKLHCSLLTQSGLPPTFWAEAEITNYLRNCCPTESPHGKTLYEIWRGQKKDVSYFREFRWPYYILNRRPSIDKFETRWNEDKFKRYSEQTQGYRVWTLFEKKIAITRDINFLGVFLHTVRKLHFRHWNKSFKNRRNV